MTTCATCAAERDAPWLFARQPETVFGTPDALVSRGVSETLDATASFIEDIERAVRGKSSAKEISAALKAIRKRAPKSKVAAPIRRELLQGAMLGALDAGWEAENDEAIAVERFSRTRLVKVDTGFTGRKLEDAVREFLKRKPVTREVFDDMSSHAQRQAFTVANAATESMVETVQRELARQVAKGADLEDFGKHAAKRLEAAGWTPQNPSHLENVFRTNVLGSYGGGRAHQMTQEEVLRRRPFWQILGVRDSRQRKNHTAMMGIVLRADDPFWLEAYPPFGYNCRCRTRSLNLVDGASKVQEGKNFARYVPDPGFTSGLPAVMGGGVPDLAPANDTIDDAG